MTATGSFSPDSASSVRASFFLRVDPRSTEKIAALSVPATIEPSRKPSSQLRSRSRWAATPVSTAVPIVPSVASERLGATTLRMSSQPATRPPSNRISARAMIPIVRANSTSSREPPKSISPRPSEPSSMPRPRNSTSPGTRRRPAARAAPMPAASRMPAARMSPPSLTGRSSAR